MNLPDKLLTAPSAPGDAPGHIGAAIGAITDLIRGAGIVMRVVGAESIDDETSDGVLSVAFVFLESANPTDTGQDGRVCMWVEEYVVVVQAAIPYAPKLANHIHSLVRGYRPGPEHDVLTPVDSPYQIDYPEETARIPLAFRTSLTLQPD